jgi:phospholipid/cholesterol/gamma-HCH transport system substrate-binding protein
MRNISVEIKVGVVVIVAAVILFFGIIWVKDYKFNVERYRYAVLFPNIGSLEIGDPVSVLGVKKGEVLGIEISGNNVLVSFNLTKDIELNSDAKFTVMNIGLMGERFINIAPGVSSEPLDLSYPVHGFYDTGIPEVMGMMGAAMDEVRHLIAVLEGTIGTPAATTSIKNIIDNMEVISTELRALTVANKEKMSVALDDLSASSAKLREFTERNEQKMQGIVDDMGKASGDFAVIAARIDTLSESVHKLVLNLEAGKGTLGKTLQDDELYEKLIKSVSDLDTLITDIKANPKKYIHFSIF